VGCLLVMVCCFACTGLFVRMMSLHFHRGVHIGFRSMSKGLKVIQNPAEEYLLFWPQSLIMECWECCPLSLGSA
jgi:hypothetical protein